jgi:hypothetical protein
MTVEGTFVLFLLGAFALMLLITFARQLSVVWSRAVSRFGIFELLLVLVGFLQWTVLARTDDTLHLAASAQNASAETAEKLRLFTEATERAWIPPISTISGPLAKDGKGLKLTLTFIMRNTGHTPAMFVFPSAQLFLRKGGLPDYLAEQTRWCDRDRQQDFSPRNLGLTIFPGDTRAVPLFNVTVLEEEVREKTLPNGLLFPAVVGCINYQYVFSKEWHQSGFVYTIRKRDGSPITIGELDIPPENLYLEEHFSDGGAFFAN